MIDFFRTYGEIGKKATALFLTEEKRRFAFWEEWLMDGLIRHSETINRLLARYGVKFGIYKTENSKSSCSPLTPFPGSSAARNSTIWKRACGSGWMP